MRDDSWLAGMEQAAAPWKAMRRVSSSSSTAAAKADIKAVEPDYPLKPHITLDAFTQLNALLSTSTSSAEVL